MAKKVGISTGVVLKRMFAWHLEITALGMPIGGKSNPVCVGV